ncbi:MAG: DUF6178 family protein [Myxococcota bacterium]|nr:DUF6178 family protein [Myxococcota bacterium]
MAALRTLPRKAREILELARDDRSAARQALGRLSLDAQVALVCESPLSRRAELLDLAPEPESLVPALPPAELCFVASAVGLADAGWLLEHASDTQLTTCVDLDAWQPLTPDRERLGQWLEALADAGEPTLLRAAHSIDMELWALHLRERVAVEMKPSGDEDWSPPTGGQSLDGQLFFVARDPKDDLNDLVTLLRTLFQNDYWFYFRLLQAVAWEASSENEEWALRWRAGRLQDMGFPPWEEAMAIYGSLRPEQLPHLAEAAQPIAVGEWPLPVWMPELPVAFEGEEAPLLFRAMAELRDEEERRALSFAFLSLANRVAVADGMALGDAESLPVAIDKAARVASGGLAFLCEEHGIAATEVLQRTSLDRLFRVGFHLDDSISAPATRFDDDEADEAEDGETEES